MVYQDKHNVHWTKYVYCDRFNKLTFYEYFDVPCDGWFHAIESDTCVGSITVPGHIMYDKDLSCCTNTWVV